MSFMFVLWSLWSPLIVDGSPASYREAEIWQPVTLTLKDTTETPTLWCKTKIMTSVFLPLAEDDLILEILTGDDEKLWQVGGEGTTIFSVKPAHAAEQTTALVRTLRGEAFQFRLFNLDVPEPEHLALEPEALVAYQDYATRMHGYAPYVTVVLRLRSDRLSSGKSRLAERERELAEAVATYRARNQELESLRAQLREEAETRIQEGQAQWVHDYARLVDDAYRVRYRRFSGARKRLPLRTIYNDGVFTWVHWEKAPILHVVEIKPDGSHEVVNFTVDKHLYRIDRVAGVLAFRERAKGPWLVRIERRRP